MEEAVESVRQQKYHPLEIIIVDDGSTDETAKIASSFGGEVKYMYQKNSGPAAARNQGLALARGNVVGFLDVDDLWTKGSLGVQLSFLLKEPSAGIVLGYTQFIREKISRGGVSSFAAYAEPWPSLHLSSAIIRKSVFDKIGGFDEEQKYCDDVDWFLRAQEAGISMVIHQGVTSFYRRHRDNLTNKTEIDRRYFLAALKKSIDRRRKNSQGKARPLPKWLRTEKE